MSASDPEMKRSTICLNMIVRNEAHVIKRALMSIKPHVQYYVIVDTGSTDGTQDIIRAYMEKAGIPGEIHQREWKDFATNRNEAIELARGKADYLMILDADDVIVGACPSRLVHSHYAIRVEDGSLEYERCHIFRSDLPFHYVGVLHEYLEAPPPSSDIVMVRLSSLTYRRYHEGARSKGKQLTYKNDAEVLGRAMEIEKDPTLRARYAYYRAQSYGDAGMFEEALAAYQGRTMMEGGFLEETFISFYRLAGLLVHLNRSAEEIERAYMRAYEFRPSRIEPIHDLCLYLRNHNMYRRAFTYAKSVADVTTTSDILFIDRAIYDWKMQDELALAAFYSGEKNYARQVTEKLLKNNRLPAEQIPRMKMNLRHCAEIGELSYDPSNIPENHSPTKMGSVIDRMRENIGVGGTEFGAMMTLFALATSIRAETIVEVGRFRGASTFALGSALKLLSIGWKEAPEAHQRREIDYTRLEDPTVRRHLFSIEKYPLPEVKDHMRDDGLEPFITYLDKPSDQVTPGDLEDRPVDLAFIDGDHSYAGCMNDVMRFMPLVREGGYLIVHDYYGWFDQAGNNNSPIKQVCDVLEKDFEHLLIDTGYMSLMIFRKTGSRRRVEPVVDSSPMTLSEYDLFVNKTLADIEASPIGQYTIEHVLTLPQLKREGLWLEFGCYTGTSIKKLAAARGAAEVFGFDSFEGLPEDWRPKENLGKGAFALSNVPPAPPGAEFVVGWFEDTLPKFRFNSPVTLVHIDCDIYSAALCALKGVLPFIIPGTIIVFDELTGYAEFKDHEMKALFEISGDGLEYRWISHQGPLWKNSAALIVTRVNVSG